MSTSRRDFIKFVVAGAVASGCPVDHALLAENPPAPPAVEGEDNRICHQVRDGHVFTRPPSSAQHDIVIVGGGMSGLVSAYLLQHRDFLLLEKEPHFGGNAYLMDYQGMTYGTGAAFSDSEITLAFGRELGLPALPVDNFDPSIINGKFIADTWGDGLDQLPYSPAVREDFKKFRKEMLAIDLAKRGKELWAAPFTDLMKGYPAELKTWWDGYGMSSWGAASEDTAAYEGVVSVQWLAGEHRKDDRYTWPGGLGAISKALVDTLQPRFKDRMKTGATIVAVVPGKQDVQVTYMEGDQLKTVTARAVIMATPKFITRRVVEGIPGPESEAMAQIRYAPYAVVNLIYDKPVYNQGYDTWCPGNTFTDFIVADWVVRNQPGYRQKFNILTCYTPLHEEDRAYLLTEQSARKVAVDVLRDFQKLFPGSNVDPVEVHLYRRGHPMYMTTPRLYTEVQPVVRQPLDRVFFANTDSEGPYSSTTFAIVAARRAVKEAESRLAGSAAAPAAQAGGVL